MTDMIGATLVGAPILLFIGCVFLVSGGPAAKFIVLIACVLVFGLYHMVGRKQEASSRCVKCGAAPSENTPRPHEENPR